MNLKLMLPVVKYKDIPAGKLFTRDGSALYVMTYEKTENEQIPVAISVNRENSVEEQEVNLLFSTAPLIKRVINSGNLMKTFGAFNEHQLMTMDFYLVAIVSKITEIY